MSSADLTESERKFLETAMTCLKSPPELDTAKLSEILGIKPKSVTNKWWEIKKKLWGGATHTPATPNKGGDDDDASAASTGNKRKRTAADAGDGASPAPKARKPRAKKEPGAATPKAGKGKNAKVKPEAKVESEEDEKKEGILDSDDTDRGEV
ncbi:hypothetical protein V8F33_009443 [Rhypophila sp. PSN 637]